MSCLIERLIHMTKKIEEMTIDEIIEKQKEKIPDTHISFDELMKIVIKESVQRGEFEDVIKRLHSN